MWKVPENDMSMCILKGKSKEVMWKNVFSLNISSVMVESLYIFDPEHELFFCACEIDGLSKLRSSFASPG